MRLINLTPHTVNLGGVAYPSEGVARVKTTTRPAEIPGLPVPAVYRVFGDIDGLPEFQEDAIYITSAVVANAAGRGDVCHPTEFIRDGEGRIVGAAALAFPYRY